MPVCKNTFSAFLNSNNDLSFYHVIIKKENYTIITAIGTYPWQYEIQLFINGQTK